MKFPFVSILLFILLGSCTQKKPTDTPTSALTSYQDTAFAQEYHEAYPISESPLANEVRSIVVDASENVWVATAAGVFVKKNNDKNWLSAIPETDQGPSYSVEVDTESTVWISNWKSVYRFKDNKLESLPGTEAPVSALCSSPQGVYAVGPKGIWLYSTNGFEKKNYPIARSIRDVITDDTNGVWLASDVGLYHATPEKTSHYYKPDTLISAYVRGVAFDTEKKLWAGGLGGVTILQEAVKVKILNQESGIPSNIVNCIKRAPDGVMWVGTDMGVVRYLPDGSHSLRFSRRWLLNDKVNDIAFDTRGNAWVATAGGVSAIKHKEMTLATKEKYFYDVLMRRHIREPWIAGQCRLDSPGDTLNWKPEDDDNDGEFGGNYLAMESFRYAVTKSNDAKEKAAKAFRFLRFLQEVTETDGFYARTIVPSTWTFVHDVNHTFTEKEKAEELVKEPRFKPVETRWHKSKDGKWLWKGDTSSDEMCGHVFGYFFYYELVADENEKTLVRNHIRNVIDHIIANNFTLTDVDHAPTRWGMWSPDRLNRDPEWLPDRSLNSMEMLAFLKLAYYVTNDQKYESTYLRLINEEGYLKNMENIPNQNPAWYIYYDVTMASYLYPILLKEKDPTLHKFYEDHFDTLMKRHAADKNPLFNFIYSYSRNKKIELQSSVEFLVDTPLDLVDWYIDHKKREDIKIVHSPVLDDVQVNELPPPSIRATVRWDKNPWGINGGDARVEREPVFWLLPYYMGRYLNMIE